LSLTILLLFHIENMSSYQAVVPPLTPPISKLAERQSFACHVRCGDIKSQYIGLSLSPEPGIIDGIVHLRTQALNPSAEYKHCTQAL